MRKIAEVLRLHHECSSSQRDIALAVGVSPTTVGEYVRRAKSAGIGYPLPAGMNETTLQAKLFPARPAIKAAPPDPDWAIIHQELARKHVTRELLWQEYKAEHPEGYRYSAFCERYRAWAGKLAVSMRQTHRPGEKLFVDQLGSHVRALEFFGGAPEMVVPDNLRSGVKRPDFYEPDLNPSYQDWAVHDELAVIPARVRHPQDKAKVEAGVLVASRWIIAALCHRRSFSLDELNRAVAALLEHLNNRPFKKPLGL